MIRSSRSLQCITPAGHYAQCGFSMIEVLVTLLIVSLALLGTAGLQSYSMRLNQGGQFRSQAVFLVADLAERIEANKLAALAGDYVLVNTSAAGNPSTACYQSACSQSALAAYDLSVWANAVSASLPQSSWSVERTVSGNPSTYVITVRWVDRRENTTQAAYSAASATGINAAGSGERFSYVATRTVGN